MAEQIESPTLRADTKSFLSKNLAPWLCRRTAARYWKLPKRGSKIVIVASPTKVKDAQKIVPLLTTRLYFRLDVDGTTHAAHSALVNFIRKCCREFNTDHVWAWIEIVKE